MTNNDLYNALLNILRKESKGLAVSPDGFTSMLQVENLTLFNDYFKVFETSGIITDALQIFKANATISLTADGGTSSMKGDLPATYEHFTAVETATGKPVDVVTEEEWVIRRNDALTIPTSNYPILRIAGDDVYVLPASMSSVVMYYLKTPATPFFDYYLDATYNIKYLTQGQAPYTLQAGEEYCDGTTSGAKTSVSIELEWDDKDKIKILHRILAKMGVGMDEQLVAQYAISKENA